MKAYKELTRLGRIRRLRRLALAALEDYDLEIDSFRFLTIDTNTTFKLRTTDRKRYVLRIYTDEDTDLNEVRAEMFWLQAIVRDTDLRVAEPIPRRDGEILTVINFPGVPEELPCAVFTWVPGRVLEKHLSPENYYKLGKMMARLHQHSATLNPLPPEIHPMKWDKVFYFPDEPIVYNTPEYSHLFPQERIAMLNKVINRADEVFAHLFAEEDGLILIHGDLHFWNVNYHRGDLYLMDFGDISLGYPVQDIAITLYYGRERDGYLEWRKAFQDGYSSVLSWPTEDERTIATLMAARSVNFINYVARIDSSPEEFISRLSKNLEQYVVEFC